VRVAGPVWAILSFWEFWEEKSPGLLPAGIWVLGRPRGLKMFNVPKHAALAIGFGTGGLTGTGKI